MTFIVVVGDTCGIGDTLEDALQELKDSYGHVDNEDVIFYEAKKIDVEFKVVKKSQPVQVRK